ncbi:hypothetical protein SAMN05216227_101035 [Pseudorhodobacter antarcticus]|jgi:hypothetical protein|uniref:Uncharacterized protein n=1 Tax=Pseudorhodobacter antarcticus TaxID=1077947 RepID=A0A1H8F668_9RHOB|nr:hypothetical protein [Pseudorhodobacter antarcticus]SEN26884.1 hypothetical protein SAMN05216227_101035 [Pseudorhodobacter antarcticus]
MFPSLDDLHAQLTRDHGAKTAARLQPHAVPCLLLNGATASPSQLGSLPRMARDTAWPMRTPPKPAPQTDTTALDPDIQSIRQDWVLANPDVPFDADAIRATILIPTTALATALATALTIHDFSLCTLVYQQT